ncbi:unnamed protein product, partial [Citrullus colocynthis]
VVDSPQFRGSQDGNDDIRTNGMCSDTDTSSRDEGSSDHVIALGHIGLGFNSSIPNGDKAAQTELHAKKDPV